MEDAFNRMARAASYDVGAFNALLTGRADHSMSDGLAFRLAEGHRAIQELYEAHVAAIKASAPSPSTP